MAMQTDFQRPTPLVALGAALMAVLHAIADASDAMACAREAERLMALSDDELAARGLAREQVVGHAFARYVHTA